MAPEWAAGGLGGCIGAWFSGRWYVKTEAYVDELGNSVRWQYENRTWLTSSFIND